MVADGLWSHPLMVASAYGRRWLMVADGLWSHPLIVAYGLYWLFSRFWSYSLILASKTDLSLLVLFPIASLVLFSSPLYSL